MDDGHVVIDSIETITLRQVTSALARESGFDSRNDLLQVARHGKGGQVFLIRFHYLPPGAWDAPPRETAAITKAAGARTRPSRTSGRDGFDLVRTLAQTLPGVEEGTSYGAPALKVGGKMFACLPAHRSAEPNTLVVRVDLEQRNALLADDPQTYYLTDHYVDHPCVLVRLTRIHRDALRDLLTMAWRFESARKKRR
jgi:hypothetical protein